MNLLHHLVVTEKLREMLLWPRSDQGQMLLGAIAPDAHTEVPGLTRAALHPETGDDPVAYTLDLAGPENCASDSSCRVFLVGVIAHIVTDEMTRRNNYHLPPHAPSGFQPVAFEDGEASEIAAVIDIGEITGSLMRASSQCALGPVPPGAVDRKRWQVLGRWPLTEGRGEYLVAEPLLTVARHCAGEALMRMYRSDAGADLLGGWRP